MGCALGWVGLVLCCLLGFCQSEVVEVRQGAPHHQNMESSRLPLGSAVRIGPFPEGFVFSFKGCSNPLLHLPLPVPHVLCFKVFTPSKQRKWQEGVLIDLGALQRMSKVVLDWWY